jgi:hypothetical protein
MQANLETLLTELVATLAELEREMDGTLPHSDQEILERACEYTMAQIKAVEEMIANLMEDTRVGCEACSGCAYCDETMGYDPNGEI